jgi:hypothetical protein
VPTGLGITAREVRSKRVNRRERGSATERHAVCSGPKVRRQEPPQPGATMTETTAFATIDLDVLALINGGDAWQDYKDTVSKDWNDTTARWNEAVKNNLVNGHWNFGKWADNFAGAVFNGGKTAWDVTGGLITKVFR